MRSIPTIRCRGRGRSSAEQMGRDVHANGFKRRVPALLNRYIEVYLNQLRPVLLGSGLPTNSLWISSTTGGRLTTKNLGTLISKITSAFPPTPRTTYAQSVTKRECECRCLPTRQRWDGLRHSRRRNDFVWPHKNPMRPDQGPADARHADDFALRFEVQKSHKRFRDDFAPDDVDTGFRQPPNGGSTGAGQFFPRKL